MRREYPSLLLSEGAARYIQSDLAGVLIGPHRTLEAGNGAPADVAALVDATSSGRRRCWRTDSRLLFHLAGRAQGVGAVLVVPIRGRAIGSAS